jgi:hypothetical protein
VKLSFGSRPAGHFSALRLKMLEQSVNVARGCSVDGLVALPDPLGAGSAAPCPETVVVQPASAAVSAVAQASRRRKGRR